MWNKTPLPQSMSFQTAAAAAAANAVPANNLSHKSSKSWLTFAFIVFIRYQIQQQWNQPTNNVTTHKNGCFPVRNKNVRLPPPQLVAANAITTKKKRRAHTHVIAYNSTEFFFQRNIAPTAPNAPSHSRLYASFNILQITPHPPS